MLEFMDNLVFKVVQGAMNYAVSAVFRRMQATIQHIVIIHGIEN